MKRHDLNMKQLVQQFFKWVAYLWVGYECVTCLTPGMGMQRVESQQITRDSMVQIFNAMQRNFPNYKTKLMTANKISVYKLDPSDWGRVEIDPYHYVVMRSKENNIIIEYVINYSTKKNPFVGIRISYYLKGDNYHERLDELKDPMENVKKCLIDTFSNEITENDFIEQFLHVPHQLRGWLTDE